MKDKDKEVESFICRFLFLFTRDDGGGEMLRVRTKGTDRFRAGGRGPDR